MTQPKQQAAKLDLDRREGEGRQDHLSRLEAIDAGELDLRHCERLIRAIDSARTVISQENSRARFFAAMTQRDLKPPMLPASRTVQHNDTGKAAGSR